MGSRGPKLVDVTMTVIYKRRGNTTGRKRVTVVHNVPEGDAKACKRAWQQGKNSFRLESVDRTEGGLYCLEPVTDIGIRPC